MSANTVRRRIHSDFVETRAVRFLLISHILASSIYLLLVCFSDFQMTYSKQPSHQDSILFCSILTNAPYPQSH